MSITTDDVRKHLGPDASRHDDETIAAVLVAEAAAQRSYLTIPPSRPKALDEALLIRVAHNLATTGGKPLVRCGIHAEGVRDLEAPFSKIARPEPTPKRRGAKKASAKKKATTTAATTERND